MQLDAEAVELVRSALIIVLKLAAPIVMAGVVVGLVISILQSITSIQDQTLAMIPKIVAMIVVTALLVPWIVQRLVEYARELLNLVQGT
jgi:flagellar biosynthetic protein FliQ